MSEDKMKTLNIKICGIEFKSPIIAASGTFGYGVEFASSTDLNKIGGISVKGLSINPHEGNPMPRICETHSGMLNAIGLQNVGAHKFIKEKLPILKKRSDAKIIANFWGTSIDEYASVAEVLDNSDVDMLEMNISCPNVKCGGITFSSNPEHTRAVVREVRKRVKNKPLIIKLSPNVTDIKEFAKVCEDEGADAISAINTLVAMAIDINSRKPKLANITGGLSGPAIKPIGVRAVYEIFKTVKIPIIAMGGIVTYEDIIEYFLAGASMVQVGTANFIDHNIIPKLTDDLAQYCKDKKIKNISELTGGVII